MQVTLSPGWIGLFFTGLVYVVTVTGFLFKIATTLAQVAEALKEVKKDVKSNTDTINDHETRLSIAEDRRHEYRRAEDKILHST